VRCCWTVASPSAGKHYRVENARLYTRPDTPPKVYVSAFGPTAIDVAARIADGYISTKPDADLLRQWRDKGGGDKPAQAGYKVCWSEDEGQAVKTVHRLWPNQGVPGELAQVLPQPAHFEQAATLVTEDMVRDMTVCGNDVDRHVEQFRQYTDAGFDEVYISQIGPEQEGFFRFYRDEVLPQLRG
jgi:G6PDH family F420-dependent oxidoreductase